MKLLHSILKAILYKPVKRTRLFEMLDRLGCEIKAKPKHFKRLGKSVDEISEIMKGGIYSEDNGLIRIDNSEKVFSVNRIDEAIKALGNYNISRVSEVNNIDEANGYINRKKEIEGLSPIGLWSMKRRSQEGLSDNGQKYFNN